MRDLTTSIGETLDKFVDTVRNKIVNPARATAKGIVYGIFAVILLGMAVVLFIILIFRLLTLGLPAWAAYTILGGIFVVAGLFCWSRRNPKTPRKHGSKAPYG